MSNHSNPYLIPGAILLAAILIVGAIVWVQTSDSGQLAQTGQLTGPDEVNINIEGWPTLGDPAAPITIVEYSDYACPFCGRFWSETLPQLKTDYIDTGQVYFIYKDFAVVGGDRAAEAAHCAAEQDAYWDYHDLLFANLAQDSRNWSDPSIHRQYAQELGLDDQALVTCFDERRYQDKVAESTQEAVANGAGGTPHFFINQEQVVGAQPFEVFESIIEAQLAELN